MKYKTEIPDEDFDEYDEEELEIQIPKRDRSNCISIGVIGIFSLLIIFIIFLVSEFSKAPKDLRPPIIREPADIPYKPYMPMKSLMPESMLYDPTFLEFSQFKNTSDHSNGYFSIGVLNADIKRRTLQNILCPSHRKSFCFHRYPAEVIGDLATVSIIYSPTVKGWDKMPLLYNHTQYFNDYMESFGISTCLLESTTDEEEFVMTKPDSEPHMMQIKNNGIFYKRENMLNVAIKKLLNQTDWQIFAWIDAHQVFTNSYWWEETIVKAPKVGVIQLGQRFVYQNEKNESAIHFGFGSVYILDLAKHIDFNRFTKTTGVLYFGNAWAMSREMYKKIGYLFDEGIAGTTDWIISMAARHNGNFPLQQIQSDNYLKVAVPWVKKALPIMNDRGKSVRGTLRHIEHERAFFYGRAIEYVRATYTHKSLLDVLHRNDDFSLVVNDPDFTSHTVCGGFYCPI